ncbi:DUF607-domain-containing protein [Aulographum hederae CBS 113979]|uniref:Calcium uniporter protein, mitochondrial n=1 Tax=Aulographum hederae CBS 113979 TaxID=1176131 RepID=A0A6G1GTV5_9PEZI|nr:DUF607-domain-containing protein [Aulographum hederae CBS 113979]
MKSRAWCTVTRVAPTRSQAQRASRLAPSSSRASIRNHGKTHALSIPLRRALTTSGIARIDVKTDSSHSRPADELNHDVSEEEQQHYDKQVIEDKSKQFKTPWHREGSDKPPVARQRSAGAMTKGKLLTTPSRMLKLILPLTTVDANKDRKDVEPLALLVHPQQPLSYLERLIQSELPVMQDPKSGKDRVPNVHFRAEDSTQDSIHPTMSKEEEEEEAKKEVEDENEPEGEEKNLENPDETRIGNETAKTGKLNQKTPDEAASIRGGVGEGGVESYSGLGREAAGDPAERHQFVRWSSSTEIGDFIRDAARGKEFAVEIEGAPREIRVGVPSFSDRTYYLRTRLRNKTKAIADMAEVKKECDKLAHKSAQNVAFGGFGLLAGWWGSVYYLTFQTDYGWDVMEPVTYLVGLSTLIGGYVWFLYHNREVSYRSAMNITISTRQHRLYESRGFDLRKWESLIEDANKLTKEIKAIAAEYDVEWDEQEEIKGNLGKKGKGVAKALKKERRNSGNSEKKKGKDGEEDDDDDD